MPILRIGNTGPAQIIATTTRQDLNTNLFVENLGGWDDMPEETRVVHKKPNGDGDWVSGFATLSAKEIEVVLVMVNRGGSVRSLRSQLASLKGLKQNFPVSWEYTDDGDTIVETLECYFPESPILWNQRENSFVRASVPIKSISPWKTITINGEASGLAL